MTRQKGTGGAGGKDNSRRRNLGLREKDERMRKEEDMPRVRNQPARHTEQ